MPVEACQADGLPGSRWGAAGKCFTYQPGDEAGRRRSRQRATNQGLAIGGGTLQEMVRAIEAEPFMDQHELRNVALQTAKMYGDRTTLGKSARRLATVIDLVMAGATDALLTRAAHPPDDDPRRRRRRRRPVLRAGPLDGRIDKDAADYREALELQLRQDERCASCRFFQYDTVEDRAHTCELVEGLISPQWICDLWRIGSADPSQQEFDDGSQAAADEFGTSVQRSINATFDPALVLSKNGPRRYTMAPVYQATNDIDDPNVDRHNEFTTADELFESRVEYVRQGDHRIFLQHKTIPGMRHKPAGEWIGIFQWPREETFEFTVPGQGLVKRTVPANSVWMETIWEPWAWKMVEDGEILGYSFGGVARRLDGAELDAGG